MLKLFFKLRFTDFYEKQEYIEEHQHHNLDIFEPSLATHFVGIHYLSFDKKRHSPTSFVGPLTTERASALEFNSHQYEAHHSPKIEEGGLIMFPWWVKHFVPASDPTEDYPRITINFMFTARGCVGSTFTSDCCGCTAAAVRFSCGASSVATAYARVA